MTAENQKSRDRSSLSDPTEAEASEDAYDDLSLKARGRLCKYRGDKPCTQPLLLCEECLYYLPTPGNTLSEKKPFDHIDDIVERIPTVVPYVSLVGPAGEPALEIGVKGTF